MKEGQKSWTKEESVLALNLYSKLLFGQMHARNPEIIELADLLDRTPSSVALRLVNFASLDPKLSKRGIKGMGNSSKLDQEVWNEYMHNWDEQFIEGEKLLAKKKHTTVEKLYSFDLDKVSTVLTGREKQRLISVRVNQSIFRRIVLTNYNNQCCITGISITELLVASHILPWSQDENNRLNPKNGLSLNTLHDKAFDNGLITITEDLKIKISSTFHKHKDIVSIKQNFIDFDGKDLIAPKKFYPDVEFLKVHNERFKN